MGDEFRAGVRDALPLLVGIVPFALVAGVAAVDAGLTLPQAVGLSVVVFAGAAQLAALDLIGSGAPLAVVVATGAVVNLRLLMYSATIAPSFRSLSTRGKALVSYVLTDQAFAMALANRAGAPGLPAYYLGISATLWLTWQAGTVAGVVLGARIPEAWGLTFAVPLVFLALLVPAVEDRATAAAAAVAALSSVPAGAVPLELGLVVAAVLGVGGGLAADRLGWADEGGEGVAGGGGAPAAAEAGSGEADREP